MLGHAVREFMPDDVHGQREAIEEVSVAIAIDHLLAIPEGIVVGSLIVHGGIQRHAVAVQRVAFVHAPEEVVRQTGAIVGLIDGGIGAGRIAF